VENFAFYRKQAAQVQTVMEVAGC